MPVVKIGVVSPGVRLWCGFADDMASSVPLGLPATVGSAGQAQQQQQQQQPPQSTLQPRSSQLTGQLEVGSQHAPGKPSGGGGLPSTPSLAPLPPEAAATLEHLKRTMQLEGQPPTPLRRPATPATPQHVFAVLQCHHLGASAAVVAHRVQSLDVRLGRTCLQRRTAASDAQGHALVDDAAAAGLPGEF